MQVAEGGQHLDGVGELPPAAAATGRAGAVPAGSLERLAAHVLHDDVAGTCRSAGRRARRSCRCRRCWDAPPRPGTGARRWRLPGAAVSPVSSRPLSTTQRFAEVSVHGQVDPAEAAVRQAAEHLVLAADQVAGRQLGHEGERRPAVRAVPFGPPGLPVPVPAHRALARAAEPLARRYLRVGHDRGGRIPGLDGRDVHQAGAQATARGPAAAAPGPPGARGHRTGPGARAARAQRTRRAGGGSLRASRRPPGPRRRRPLRRDSWSRRGRSGRGRGQPAHRAVPAVDAAGTPGPGARGRGHGHDRRLRPLSARTACW